MVASWLVHSTSDQDGSGLSRGPEHCVLFLGKTIIFLLSTLQWQI